MRAKRSLSQNFLVDPNLQRRIVEALAAQPGDTVLEIGPGHGELTRHLVGEVGLLVLVEKDDALAAALADRWGGRDDVRVVHDDALELDLAGLVGPPYSVLSNVPYGITSPLLFRLLALEPSPTRIVVTVQKEVGERIVAAPGSKTYGSLSVGIQARGKAWVAFGVSRSAFRPVPDVDSVTVVIEPDPERIAALPEPALRELTRAAFGRRRKQLQTILRTAPEFALGREEAEVLCRTLALDPAVRPEKISPGGFVELARRLRSGDVSATGPGA